MTVSNLRDLRLGLPPGSRLLGLDPGEKRVGVALTDVELRLASPYAVIPRGKLASVAAALRPLIAREGVGGLVVGLPLALDGGFGPNAQAARDWGRDLASVLSLPLALWDERLSSAAVNRFLIGTVDMTRKRRSEVVDSMAAAYMLQAALDATT